MGLQFIITTQPVVILHITGTFMPLVSIQEQLNRAGREGFAIPLFDVFDPIAVDGVVAAIQSRQAPCILGVYSGCFTDPNIEAFAAYIRTRVKNLSTPISIMLDHGTGLEQARQAIDFGFTDVMYDGSLVSIEENMQITSQVVQLAHPRGVGVEAELGHVGQGSDYAQFGGQQMGFTKPQDAEAFVAGTGVDFLAIAFGNAHGNYRGEPRLDLGLVAEIHRRVSIPLVMHGGTGLNDEMYRAVVAAGIAKINYYTGIANAATARMVQAAGEDKPSMLNMTAALRQANTDVCSHYLDVFGASGKA
jgi:fructose-bisphosphate aldolase class II